MNLIIFSLLIILGRNDYFDCWLKLSKYMFHHALRTMFRNVSLEADECDKGSFKILFYEKICWLYKFFLFTTNVNSVICLLFKFVMKLLYIECMVPTMIGPIHTSHKQWLVQIIHHINNDWSNSYITQTMIGPNHTSHLCCHWLVVLFILIF